MTEACRLSGLAVRRDVAQDVLDAPWCTASQRSPDGLAEGAIMANRLKLDIVTPEGLAVSEDVNMVLLPTLDGPIGVVPLHAHLMTQIVPGEVAVRIADRDRYFAVGEGLVEVTAHRVTVVTDMAVDRDLIDEAAVEAARERAAARLQDKVPDEEVASVNASLARSLAQLQVKRRRV
jgi:F-type H+-transporting ATPase subunit epsilon